MPTLPADGKAGRAGLPGDDQPIGADGWLLHVVRQFENASVPPLSIDPVRDIQTMDTDFILNDLLMVERRLEKLRESIAVAFPPPGCHSVGN